MEDVLNRVLNEIRKIFHAYDIANNYDCVPDLDMIEDVDKKFPSEYNVEILKQYEGYSPSDLIGELRKVVRE